LGKSSLSGPTEEGVAKGCGVAVGFTTGGRVSTGLTACISASVAGADSVIALPAQAGKIIIKAALITSAIFVLCRLIMGYPSTNKLRP
jgi:hypothetical protein